MTAQKAEAQKPTCRAFQLSGDYECGDGRALCHSLYGCLECKPRPTATGEKGD